MRKAVGELQRFCKSKVKIVEETGDTVKDTVHKSNPWAGGDCQREDCLLCRSGDKNGDCRRRNLVYKTQCGECKEKGKDTVYVGESARTGYERGLEHQKDAKQKKENSHIATHCAENHSGQGREKFSMKVMRTHRTALTRQIHEAVVIANCWNKNLLNSKQEYNRCIIPRITVMMGTKEKDTGVEIQERELREMEEGTGREKRSGQKVSGSRAKRRRRWKVEEKVGTGKRYSEQFLDEGVRYSKRRRLHSLGQPLITRSLKLLPGKGESPVQDEIQAREPKVKSGMQEIKVIQERRDKRGETTAIRQSATKVKTRKKKTVEDSGKFKSVLKMFRDMEKNENKLGLRPEYGKNCQNSPKGDKCVPKKQVPSPRKSAAKPAKSLPNMSKLKSVSTQPSPVKFRAKPGRILKEKIKVNSETKIKKNKPKENEQVGVKLLDIRTFFEQLAPNPPDGSRKNSIFDFNSKPKLPSSNSHQPNTSSNQKKHYASKGPYTLREHFETELAGSNGQKTKGGDYPEEKIKLNYPNIPTTKPPSSD